MKKAILFLLCGVTALTLTSCARKTTGRFYGGLEAKDNNGNVDIYYQFRSDDCTVFWLLTEEELGFVPNANAKYNLIYDDNDTTRENKPCNCDQEFHCECEVYDDVLLNIRQKR